MCKTWHSRKHYNAEGISFSDTFEHINFESTLCYLLKQLFSLHMAGWFSWFMVF